MVLCMGCMAEIEEEEECCPYCGYQKGTRVKEAYYLLPGKIIGKKYIVGKVLGYGGFGVTYLGWDAQLGRKVAIKEYLPSDFATRSYGEERLTIFSGDATVQFEAGLESFITEAKKLAKFNQIPEIVDIYDCFMENDTGYIIMEFLEGETVKEILAREGKLSFEEARNIMVPVLRGLGEIHKEGIVHRDIAPDNIFIKKDGEVRILDFGAARYATAIHSRSLSIILKPGYAPEEQYRSRGNQGAWTDIYAAGASFYRMITGIKPQESIERMTQDQLKTPSELGITIPQSVENALMNSLNIKAENRIQDASVFCRVLQEQEEMERIKEEKEREESAKIPAWMKGMAGIAAVFAVVFVILSAAGKISLTRKEIRSDEGKAALSSEESYVPDISGMSYEEAEKELKELDLKLLINGMNYSETIAKNKILSQLPVDGGKIKKGETVYVVMSGGNKEVMMPDLSGMMKKDAIELVRAQNLTIEKEDIREEYSDVVEKGRVISQSVLADKKIKVKTKVQLVISLGNISEETAVLTVPDLVGMTNEEAVECLKQLKEKKGFTYTIGKITRQHSKTVEKGRIISQGLKAGSKARTDQVITLVISEGPENVIMPNVVYAKQDAAKEKLEALGLKVDITTKYSSQIAKGCVISQSQEADTEVAEGSTITLVISLGEEPVQNSSPPANAPSEPSAPAAPQVPAEQAPAAVEETPPAAEEPEEEVVVSPAEDITIEDGEDIHVEEVD